MTGVGVSRRSRATDCHELIGDPARKRSPSRAKRDVAQAMVSSAACGGTHSDGMRSFSGIFDLHFTEVGIIYLSRGRCKLDAHEQIDVQPTPGLCLPSDFRWGHGGDKITFHVLRPGFAAHLRGSSFLGINSQGRPVRHSLVVRATVL